MISMTKAKRIPAFLLRVLALSATIAATIVMVTSHDSAEVLNMSFEAKYSNSPTLKYFMIANAIASGYSLVLLFVPSKSLHSRFFFVFDLIITSLLISSISAALAIAYVAKKGNTHAGWLPICGQVPKFCDHATGALVAGFVAVIIYFLVLLYSLHNILNLITTVKA